MNEDVDPITSEHSQHRSPFVSVIIPFFNNQQEVLRIEKSLREQTYPFEKFELIFIDNGSYPPFQFSGTFLEKNILLEEKEALNSPYSARNRGIEVSKGEIIAFIDANSIPDNDWLEKGVECLQNSEYDLMGGNVAFDFQGEITAGKIVDALTSINMKKAITERGAAYTANLFIEKKVFENIGLFEEGVRSGGDVRWTMKAKDDGFIIGYCSSAVVKKYARPTKSLYKKKIRTGKGYFYTWIREPKETRRVWFYNFFRALKPPTPSKIRNLNPDRYQKEFDKYLGGIWFHLYFSRIVEQVAFSLEFFSNRLKR